MVRTAARAGSDFRRGCQLLLTGGLWLSSALPVPADPPVPPPAGIPAASGELRLQHNGSLNANQHGTSVRGDGVSVLELDQARLEVDGQILILSAPKLVKTAASASRTTRRHHVRAIPQCLSISAFGKVKLTLPGFPEPLSGKSAAYRVQQQQWFLDGKPVGPVARGTTR